LTLKSLVRKADSNNIQRLAKQQTQIQQMMSGSRLNSNSSPFHQPNPMDPQPFYIVSPDPPVASQRRTWGQPQPILFAQQSPLMPDGWQGNERHQHWGGHQQPHQRLVIEYWLNHNLSI